MTFEHILLIAGVLGLSCLVSYALWVQVRVVRLREDFFEIRDELFDFAAARGELDDPGYRDCRDTINSLIALADSVSLALIAYLIRNQRDMKIEPCPRCRSEEMQQAVDRALARYGTRFVDYIRRETISGCIAHLAFRLAQTDEALLHPEEGIRAIPDNLPRELCMS